MTETQNNGNVVTKPIPQSLPKATNGSKILSDLKFYTGYSRYNMFLERKETWDESVMRVMDMHRFNPKFSEQFKDQEFRELFEYATEAYKDKLVLASQRALQFGGDSIMKHNAKLYNCLTSYCDRPEFFQECLYWLLCGCGVGFSVQFKHINKLPDISKRTLGTKTFTVPDSIEGWSDAIGVLMSSYFSESATFTEYKGYEIKFDYSLIRPEGSLISGGFRAPGPEGLRKSLIKIEELLERALIEEKNKLKPVIAYDIVMHLSDAVLSGGVRRSATICLFSPEDKEMLNAKTGNWFYNNPQRARSNNSVLLVRGKTTREQFAEIMNSVKSFGEPGFIFTEDEDIIYNPCVSGDALITVCDHSVNGGFSVPYKIPMKMLVELHQTSDLTPSVLSYNLQTGKKEWKTITAAALTRRNAEVLEIEYHGKTLRCTPDHKVFTKNRGWVEAKDLKEEDELITDEINPC